MTLINFILIVVIGVLATMLLDLIGILLNKVFHIPTTEWRYIGRWFGYMPKGIYAHNPIYKSTAIKHELAIGWGMHYLIGIIFSIFYFYLVVFILRQSPSLLSGSIFGIVTVIFPYFFMQPLLGYGVIASRHKRPIFTPVMSFLAHLTFGQLLYTAYLFLALINLDINNI